MLDTVSICRGSPKTTKLAPMSEPTTSGVCEHCGRPITFTKIGERGSHYRWLSDAKRNAWLCAKTEHRLWTHSPIPDPGEPRYGNWEGFPARWVTDPSDCLVCVDNEWVWRADWGMVMSPWSKGDYIARFGDRNLPPLPSAFASR